MSKNTYTLTPQNQLIDLNGDLVNFDLTFSAVSKDGTPFNAVVVDQQTLDNNPQIDHKVAENGSIGGNIVADKNQYQNFFLVLKAHEKPCEVEVTIDKRPIQPNVPPPEPELSPHLTQTKPNPNPNIWKWVIIVVVIGLIGFLIWQQFGSKKKDSIPTELPQSFSTIPPEMTPPQTINSGLIDRLNKLSSKFN